MSKHIALAALERMNLQPAFVSAAHVTSVTAALQHLASANPEEEQRAEFDARCELLATYGYADRMGTGKPFAFAGGMAIIPVHGTLINRFGYSWGDITGYNFVRSQMNLAEADADVKGIIFDVNSYGGEVAGCFELVADIAALTKPTMAVVDSSSYSAGYAVASAADKIAVTPSGGVGSVGVVCMHVNVQKALEKYGVEVTMIYAGEHKVDGNPFEALPDSVREDIQVSINKSYSAFTTLVAENRGLDVQAVVDTQARTYRADDALALGLIDAIATPAQAVSAFFNELSGSANPTENTMGATTTQPAEGAAPATNDVHLARQQERERLNGILTCEEAKGRPALANYLALQTNLSVEEAKGILSVGASEQQPAATPAPEPNHFAAAMNSTQNPNVGADADGDGMGTQEMSKGKRILADYQAATGIKLQ